MKNTREKGVMGEKIAVSELIKKGYTIIDTNYYGKHGEIDIVAENNGYIIFVEVKLRTNINNGLPSEAVDKRKQLRIINTANEYIYNKNIHDKDFRFDVAEVLCKDGNILFNHIINAFWN